MLSSSSLQERTPSRPAPAAKKRLGFHTLLAIAALVLIFGSLWANASGSGNLDQAQNGGIGKPPISPVDWINGNSNGSKSHFREGHSIPYRLILEGLDPGLHKVRIEWDIKHSDKHAIDYITSKQQGISETVDPLKGLSLGALPETTFPIPPAALPPGISQVPGVMSAYGGTISSLSYVSQGDLTAAQSATRILVEVTPDPGRTTVVLSWGGHIARAADWGVGQSASGISGSPYHTRFIDLDGSGGNQDRSLAASALAPPPTVDVSVGPATVCQGETATLTANVTGGAEPFTYAWSPATGLDSTTAKSVSANPTTTTTYTVVVTDANENSATATGTVTVNPLPGCSITGPNEVCAGTLGTQFTGPDGNYGYKWTVSGGGASIASGDAAKTVTINAGTDSYTVGLTVKDLGTNCTSTCSKGVTVNPLPTVTVSPNPAAICAGGSKTLTATPMPAEGGPYTFSWTGPGGFTADTDSVSVAAQGTYSVTVRNAKGCTSLPAMVTLTVNQNPTVSISPMSKAVCEGSSATFTASGSGGGGGYTYGWTGPGGFSASGAGITVSVAGSYVVTVTDANGCTGQNTATLTVNQNPTVSVDPATREVCDGASATFTATASGGSGSGYKYSWTGPGGFTAETDAVTVSTDGTYKVIVEDSNGCKSGEASATLKVNPKPSVSVDPPTRTVCPGGQAMFTAVPSGGSGSGYTYAWTGPEGFTAATAAITATKQGTYSVQVKDSKGCESAPGTATLTISTPPGVSISGDTAICSGRSATLKANASGGTGPYTYKWTLPGGSTSTDQEITVSTAGAYSVVVTDTLGCKSAPATKTLQVFTPPSCSITGPGFVIENGTAQFTAPSGMMSYSWDVTGNATPSGVKDGQSLNVNVGPKSSGISFTVSVTVTDSNGCSSSCQKIVSVRLPSNTTIEGLKFYDANCNGEQDPTLDANLFPTEPGINGWKVRLSMLLTDVNGNLVLDSNGKPVVDPTFVPQETFTSGDVMGVPLGVYTFSGLVEGYYLVEEIFPGGPYNGSAPGWINCTPASYVVRVPPEVGQVEPLFGNLYLSPPGGGKTLGFWSNKNGEAILKTGDQDWRLLLNNLHLVNENGSAYDLPLLPAAFSVAYGDGKKYPGFNQWLLNGRALNMAYMLSVQMAVTELNVHQGAELRDQGLVGTALTRDTRVLVPDNLAECLWTLHPELFEPGTHVIAIGRILDAADASLAANPDTVAAGPVRTYQDCLKTMCDLLNNNKLPLVPPPPPVVVYP